MTHKAQILIYQSLLTLKAGLVRMLRKLPANAWFDLTSGNHIGIDSEIGFTRTLIHEPQKENMRIPVVCPEENLDFFRKHCERTTDEASVCKIPNGIVTVKENGRYLNQNRDLIWNLAKEHWTNFTHFHTDTLLQIRPTKLAGTTVSLIHKDARANFSHWLFDLLPQIDLLKRAVAIESVDQYLIDYSEAGYQLESLQQLGIPKKKIVKAKPGRAYSSDCLIVPSLFGYNNQSHHPAVIDFLKTFAKEKDPTSNSTRKKRFFLGRNDATFRFLKEEARLFKALENEGFEYVTFAGKSIEETARIMSMADIIIGVFGTAMMFTVFAPRNSTVVDIANPNFFNAHHWNIAHELGHNYYVYFGNNRSPIATPRHVEQDISIDVDDFLSFCKMNGVLRSDKTESSDSFSNT